MLWPEKGAADMKRKDSRRGFGRRVLTVASALALTGATIGWTGGQTASAASTDKLDNLKQQASTLSGQESSLRGQLDKLQGQVNSKLGEKELLEQQISVLSAQIVNTEALIAEYDVQISDKQVELEDAQAKEEEYYQLFCARFRDMEEEGSVSYWSILFSSASFSDLLDRINFVSEVVQYDNQIVDQLQDARDAVAQAKSDLETQQAEQQQAKADLETQKADLADDEAAVDEAIAEINSQKDVYASQLADVQAQASALEDQIASAQAEYEKQVAAEKAAAEKAAADAKKNESTKTDDAKKDDSSSGSSSSSSGFTWPCSSHRITSYFGKRNSPTAGASTYHKGIDIGASSGSAIYAAASGTVVTAGYSSSAGNYVTISHGNGISTTYMHCSALYVSAGDSVSQGQTIAAVGSTGISTGPHLHFAVIVNGSYQNPLNYVS